MANDVTGLRLVILEDLQEDAELMIHELRRSKFEPVWQRVDDEPDYLATLQSPPELILSDYNMPEMDAHRALRLLRDMRLDIPFIVVSGSIGEDVAVSMMREGAADYLLKDRLSRLGPAVRRVLEEKRAREEKRIAEDKLRASEKRFHLFMEHSPLLASIKDADGRFLYLNDPFEKLWGVRLPEEGALDRELLPAEAVCKLRSNDLAVLHSGQASQIVEDVPLPDGEVRNLLSIRFPYTDAFARALLGTVSVDITEQIRTGRSLAAALAAKEVLLKEVHHRVKNNLQIISSLLSMQAKVVPDLSKIFNESQERVQAAMTQAFRESQQRVHAMAAIHELLYGQDDVERLDFEEYVRMLATELFGAYGVDSALVRLNLQLAPVTMTLKQAVPCGLILNELLTNSLKHAFTQGANGNVTVELSRDSGDRVTLRVADTGVGMPAGFDSAHSRSLGMKIVGILTRQLHGVIRQEPGPGAGFWLTFPAE
jgi:PAS domain S-box-containing protein